MTEAKPHETGSNASTTTALTALGSDRRPGRFSRTSSASSAAATSGVMPHDGLVHCTAHRPLDDRLCGTSANRRIRGVDGQLLDDLGDEKTVLHQERTEEVAFARSHEERRQRRLLVLEPGVDRFDLDSRQRRDVDERLTVRAYGKRHLRRRGGISE